MKNTQLNNMFGKYFPFWSELTDIQQNLITSNTIEKSYRKGASVYTPNDNGGVIFLKKGCLRIYMISEQDKELTLLRFHSNDLCILSTSCITDTISFDIYIDAEDDCECYYINNSIFEKINNECPYAKIFALETTVDCMSDMIWIMEQILFMSMDKRLAIFLLDEISRTDTDTVMLTHSLIAKYMGSAREVVSRMLKYFENEGIVELSRRGVRIVDKGQLRNTATKECV